MALTAKPKVCCVCGKLFYPPPLHTYKRKWKRRVYYACKPSCYEKLLDSIEKSGCVNKSLDKNTPRVL